MKTQVHAILVFIGVVFLTTAFLQGSVVEKSSGENIAQATEDSSSIDSNISSYGSASAILALRDNEYSLDPFGANKDDDQETGGEDLESSAPDGVVTPATPPTICNVYITQPQVGATVPNSFVISGYVDNIQNGCRWTIFEANAGYVEVYDENGNLLGDYAILQSVGEWMQTPSYFQTLLTLSEVPETQWGYIRFYENVADDSTPDVFDFPIVFTNWSVAPTTTSFLDTINNILTSKKQKEKARKNEEERMKDRGIEAIFGTGKDTPSTTPVLPAKEGSVPLLEKDENFCEIRKENKLICYGSYIGESTVCGCDTFSDLESLRDQERLVKYKVNLENVVFEKTLFIGDRGDAVVSLQEALYSLGFYDQIPSAVYDSKTVKAVRSFQKEHDLSGWGLILGDSSKEVLNSLFSN